MLGLAFGAFGTFPTSVLGQDDTTSPAVREYYRGYYLQHQRHDQAAALEAYEKSLSLGADAQLQRKIENEVAGLREDLATADFAQLMPAETVAYLEVARPAEHIEKLAQLLGLSGRHFAADYQPTVLRLDDEIEISSDFQISPALMRELRKMGGAAIGVTKLNTQGPPEGLAVVHLGDSDLVTGLIETGLQLVPAEEQIKGFPTFHIEDEVWLVKTHRLIIASAQKSSIAQCLEQIANPEAPSLADQETYRRSRHGQKRSGVFALAQPQAMVQQLGHLMRGEMAMARMLLDLDHMEYWSASLAATDSGLRLRSQLSFEEGHNSLAYGLFRTMPLSQKATAQVPRESAAMLALGLNPELVLGGNTVVPQQITGLDIGREFFANIEELALFVLPSLGSNQAVPDVGLVIAANDADKSERLWNQLLSLPSMMQLPDGPQASDFSIAGVAARRYVFDDDSVPPIVVARLSNESLVAGTAAAVEAAFHASRTETQLIRSSSAKGLSATISEDTAKVVYANVSRLLELGAQMSRGGEAQQMRMVAEIARDMNVILALDESPNQLQLQIQTHGLPQFEQVIKTAKKMQNQRGGLAHRSTQHSASDIAVER